MTSFTRRLHSAKSPIPMNAPFLAVEATYGRLASEQLGLVTTEQLRSLGMSSSGVSRRVRAGVLIQMLPRVLRLASVPRSWHQRALAVHLWAGPESVIGGPAAATLHRLDGFPQCSKSTCSHLAA